MSIATPPARRRHRLLPLLLLAAGCGAPETRPSDLASTTAALGEPIAGRPSYFERVALYATDRARVDPAHAASGWSEFAPVPPLLWNDALGRSALAHSEDLRDTPCFQHDSCDGTPTFDRVRSYYTESAAALGENIAAGISDPFQLIDNWLDEVGAPAGEDGHRKNIFSDAFHYVGLGYAPGGSEYRGYWTQDFAGARSAPAVPPLAAGAHYFAGDSDDATFGVVYYDAASVAPRSVSVVVDGKAIALSRVNGNPGAGAYEGSLRLGPGCHRYYFRAEVGDEVVLYPDGGTLGAAEDASECAEYQAGGVDNSPSGKSGGGCSAGGGRAPSGGGAAWLSLLGLALWARRARTA